MSVISRDRSKTKRLLLVWFAAVTLLLGGCGQRETKVHRVGILCGLDVFLRTVDGFKEKMAELGYIEGKNIVYDFRKSNFDTEAERRVLRDFVKAKVDVVVALPTEAALEAKAALRETGIPLVFCQTNIEGVDLIQSIREPGGNITGVRYPGPDLALKRFEILHELVPHAGRFWVPYWKNSPIVPSQLQMLRPVAAQAGVILVESPVADASELEADLNARSKATDVGFEAILLISEPLARTPAAFPKIAKFAAEHKLPIGGVQFSLANYTTVFGVSTDNLAVGRLAAQQTNKVLKGAPAGTIPVVSAESYLRIHYAAARELGLTIPEGLLRQADEIIRPPGGRGDAAP